jgi:TorA maturation chaperone TorD
LDLLARAEGYRGLAACLRHPWDGGLEKVLGERLRSRAPARMLAPLRSMLDDGLEAEFHRLFAMSVAVSPHESAWIPGDKGVLLGGLASLYESFGMRAGGAEGEPSDHLGAELEFAAVLCLKEALAQAQGEREGAAACRRGRQVLLEEHLGHWVRPFAAALRARSEHPFYLALAERLPAWVERDLRENGWTAAQKGDGALERAPAARAARLPLLQDDAESMDCVGPAGGQV